MSREQREAIRQRRAASPLDLGGEVHEQRALFEQLLSHSPVPPDVVVTPTHLDTVPGLVVEVADRASVGTVLYFHGGAYVFGSARSSVGIAADLARRSQTRVLTVDYRLAPEHPAPAATDDAVRAYRALPATGVDPRRVVVAGESAGGGVALGLLQRIVAAGEPLPAAALLFSPWIDLTLSGDSMRTRAEADFIVSRTALRRRVRDYAGDDEAAVRRHSPLFGDPRGLPTTLIQVGSHEVLLDDSTRLAAGLVAADVSVTLDVTAEATHVFQSFAGSWDEADEAMNRAAAFVHTACAAG
ncbi:alpha/beta hydrolase [Actinoplanes sp. NBRC 101535]|uniref:alpha/beta hydrolase n=1 Tax=Actinoplanes sp. NBRC 101535 TaxID=3032196 RepID=UPI0024A34442|nr:alpha/beta hydrolase [Actinoplanes sp. NBRC 101535]GLY03462.1 alpha/beta hydrolase [Actinoplanes sp. NBRC 101535]